MNIMTLFLEMTVIFILILLGFIMYRKSLLDSKNARSLSILVSTLCSPALQLKAALDTNGRLSPSVFGSALGVAVLVYAILIAASYLICFLLKIKRRDRYAFQMLTVYGNTGFIGFPVCLAVLGGSSLLYASINNLVFNILIYTYGMVILRRAVRMQNTEDEKGDAVLQEDMQKSLNLFETLKPMINTGTIAAILSVLIYLFDPQLPGVAERVIGYAAGATVFLSMTVLGCTVAASPLKELFTGDRRMYLFLLVRMLVLPVIIVLLLKIFIRDSLMLGTTAIMVSLPGGNLPLMLCKKMGLEDRELSRGIILSTMICIVTIPIVCSFL